MDSAPGLATALVRALDQAGVLVDNIEVRQPSLDDVFFALTGAGTSTATTRRIEAARVRPRRSARAKGRRHDTGNCAAAALTRPEPG